jgi:hypothetical protein
VVSNYPAILRGVVGSFQSKGEQWSPCTDAAPCGGCRRAETRPRAHLRYCGMNLWTSAINVSLVLRYKTSEVLILLGSHGSCEQPVSLSHCDSILLSVLACSVVGTTLG